jgi:hypothetical protein
MHHNTATHQTLQAGNPHRLEKDMAGVVFDTDIARISQKDCNEWAARHGKDYSPTRFNGALGIVRRLFATSRWNKATGWTTRPSSWNGGRQSQGIASAHTGAFP